MRLAGDSSGIVQDKVSGRFDRPFSRGTAIAVSVMRVASHRTRPLSKLKEMTMTIATKGTKGLLISALILGLSGAAYAQGAGGGSAGGNGAGQGGTGMGTPNANGETGANSNATGGNTMGSSKSGMSHKKTQKKGSSTMDAPASGSQ
jgi:hypothetical protein